MDAAVAEALHHMHPCQVRRSAIAERGTRARSRAGRGSSTQHLPRLNDTWHTGHMDATLVLGQQGRLVIPAEVRAALGLAPGDRLHLHLTGPRLVLERQQDAVAELRALASDVPKSRSFVEELLAERRLAAATE